MSSNEKKCARCEKTIYAADKYEKYEGKIYHNNCFKCSNPDCDIKLTIRNVKGFNKFPYCDKHVSIESSSRLNDHIYVNVPSILSNENEYEQIEHKNEEIDLNNIRKTIGNDMVDDIFATLSKDMHIIVCGSPRVGKSTLINKICGKEVAKAKEGLASVTQTINCYSKEGTCNTGSNIINYKYNFWDTPGFESWEKDNIKSKIKHIIDKPETKPVCMIFCASPGTFVDLTQLEWLLDTCIQDKHIFCALVCTNKYAGPTKSRRAVLDDFNRLLSKYTNDKPRIENEINFYGNIGLIAAVNSEPYEDDDRILPETGVNELIYGIMESLVDEQVLNWCCIVLDNKDFWNNCQDKLNGLFDGFKGSMKALKKFLKWKNKSK